jgi:hypothetical protein
MMGDTTHGLLATFSTDICGVVSNSPDRMSTDLYTNSAVDTSLTYVSGGSAQAYRRCSVQVLTASLTRHLYNPVGPRDLARQIDCFSS